MTTISAQLGLLFHQQIPLSCISAKGKLTMQFANGAHMSYGEKMSTSINVVVEHPAKHMGDKK